MKIKTFFLLLFLLLPGLISAEEIVLPEAVIKGDDRSESETPSIEFEEKGAEIFLPSPFPPREKMLFFWGMEVGAGENKKSKFLLNTEVKREERFSFKNSFLFERDDGYRPNSDFRIFDFSSLFGLQVKDGEKIYLKGSYFHNELGLPGKVNNPTPDSRRKNEKRDISLEWERFFPAENGWKGKISYQQSLVKSTASSSRYRKEIASFQVGYYDAPLSFLASFSRERLENYYQVEDYTLSARIDKIQIRPDFYTYAGLKVEKRKAVGFLFLPELGISFEPTDALAIFLEGSSSLDIPRFERLYLEQNFVEVKEGILKPEHQKKVKLGVSKKISKGKIEINFFTEKKENLIIWSDRDNNGLYQPTNIKKANLWGGQIILEKQYSPYFRQKFLYTHQEVENKDPGISYIPYYPADIFENTFEIRAGRFVFEIIGKYLAKQYEQENSSERVPGYGLLETNIFYSLNKYAKIFLIGENLTNTNYELVKGYPADGRRFFGGVELKF